MRKSQRKHKKVIEAPGLLGNPNFLEDPEWKFSVIEDYRIPAGMIVGMPMPTFRPGPIPKFGLGSAGAIDILWKR